MVTELERADTRQFRRRTFAVAGVLLGVAGVLWLTSALSNLLFMVFVSVFVAVALEPPVHFLEKRGWRRGAATTVVFLVVFATSVLFIASLAPLLVGQVELLVNSIPGYVTSVTEFLESTFGLDLSEFDLESAGEDAVGYLQSLGGSLVGGIIGLTAGIAGFFIFATTVALFSFYMIAELPQLQRTVLSFMPEEQQRRALRIWEIAVEKMGGYVYSRLILAFVSATLSALFLAFLEVPFAVPLGIWVGLLSQFIPVFGTYLAAILPAIVSLSAKGTTTMLWVLLFFVAYQQVENLVFSPRITKRTMEIHPAVSIAAILIGGSLMGGIGVILALPMTGIIQAIISESRKRHDVILDDTEPATEA